MKFTLMIPTSPHAWEFRAFEDIPGPGPVREGPAKDYRAFEYAFGHIKRGGGRKVAVSPYTPREIGALLGLSAATIRAMTADDPGVLRVTGPGGRVTSKIPEETVSRLRARLQRHEGKPVVPARVPKRVIFLGNRHAAVA